MKPHQIPINVNLLLLVYYISTSCKAYQATTAIESPIVKPTVNSTDQTLGVDYHETQVSLGEQTKHANHSSHQRSYGVPALDLVVENGTLGQYSDSQLRLHSYNLSDPSSSPLEGSLPLPPAPRSDDLSTSDSSLLTKAISPKMDIEENLVDVGGAPESSSSSEDESYGGPVEGASSNLSEQRAIRELTKILSRGLAGVTDHVGVERLENWKQQQKYRKKIKDDRARLFEDILMAAIESHPEKSERYKTKRTKHSMLAAAGDDDPTGPAQNRSMPIFANYMNNLDPELAQDAETVVQNLQGIASVFGAGGGGGSSSGSEDGSSSSFQHDDRVTQDESDMESRVTTSRPILQRQFSRIKKQLSNRRKQFDQIKKIFNQDYTTTQSDASTYQQNSMAKHFNKDPNYGYDGDEFILMDDYNHQKPRSRRSSSPGVSSNRHHKLEQLSSYLLENPSALGSALAELSSASSSSSQSPHSISRKLPYVSSQLHNDGRTFSRRYRGAASSEEPQDTDNITRKPSRQDSSNNSGVRDVGPEVEKSRQLNHESEASPSSSQSSVSVQQSSPSSVMSTAETLLLNSLKERQLMNLMRLETVLAEKQQASGATKNAPGTSTTGSTLTATNTAKNSSNQLTHRTSGLDRPSSNTTNPNNRAQESIRNQKQSTKEELHHFVVVSPNPASSKPEDYGTDLSSLNIDPYDAAALDQVRPNPKLNRFRDWTDVSQSETRSSVVKDETASTIRHRNGLVETNKIELHSADAPVATDKRRSVKRVLDNHSIRESHGRPPQLRPSTAPANEINRFHNEDQSTMTEEGDEGEGTDDTSRMMNSEEGRLNEDEPEGVYMKLDRIALGSEMRTGPVDYFSAYKNEMKSSGNERMRVRVDTAPKGARRMRPKIEGDEGEEGGAAMWAR